jgi:hypothetical protein
VYIVIVALAVNVPATNVSNPNIKPQKAVDVFFMVPVFLIIVFRRVSKGNK